jgi:Domain of unknown function (DUF4365)
VAVSDAQIKGNWGEGLVMARLSAAGCLVRPVLQGQDFGIDLYCETTLAGQPHLHFWAQVKTSQSFDPSSLTCTLQKRDVKHLEYYLKQPVPVFFFMVPDQRDDLNIPIFVQSALYMTRDL